MLSHPVEHSDARTRADVSCTRVDEPAGLVLHTENAASRALESFGSMAASGTLTTLFDADFTLADQRRAPIEPVRDAVDLLRLVDQLGELGEGKLVAELLAARGDNCGLVYTALTGPEGHLTSMLVVAECGTNGLLTEVALYDLADLSEAVERMVEIYSRQLTARELAVVLPTAAVRDAISRRDWDGLDRVLTDDFEHRDCRDQPCLTIRRPLALDYFSEIVSEGDADVIDIVTEIHRITPRGLVASRTQLSVDAPAVDGTEVVLVGVRGDQVDKMEFYNDADFRVAIARLDELTS